MTKTFIFILLFSIVNNFGFAQTKDAIDSLQYQLDNAKDDTSRINAEIALCRLYRLGNTDSSLMYGEQALKSAEEIKYMRGQISVLGFMCIVMEQRGNLPKSLELGFKALQLAQEHNLEILSRPALAGIGEVYIILKEYRTAINYLRRGILIGVNEQGLAVSLIGGDVQGLAYSYWDMGVALAGLNQWDSANFYERKAIETFHKYNYEEPRVYQTLGDIEIASHDLKQAFAYYQRSLQISIEKNEPRASAYTYIRIASFFKMINKSDSAIYYAKKGLEESQLIAQKKTIYEADSLLSELYEPKDIKESLRYLKLANAYKDSLFGPGSFQAIQALIAQHDEHQKEIQDAKAKYEDQLKVYALVGGLAVVLIIALSLYRNNRQKQKANILLQQQKEKVESTLQELKSTQAQLIQSEKMASLGELTAGIAHEIQNPLNFVNNFSEVNKELIEELKIKNEKLKIEDEEVNELLYDIENNLEKINHHGKRADVIVKNMLQHSRISTGKKELTDINALADEYLRLSYHGLRAKDKAFTATIQTQLDPSIGRLNIVPQDIGRVLLNLYNNAFYAVMQKKKDADENYEPTVLASTKKFENKISISVKDNGNGIPQKIIDKIFQPFFTTKPTGLGTGLGLSLSYDIIKAHGGEIKVETREGEGTTFIIQLPSQPFLV